MRIVLTHPDGIGDAVLRLPLFQALVSAGHTLLIIARPHAIPLLHRLGANINVLALRENPYEMTRASRGDFDSALLESVSQFRPDLLVWAPYQWTIVEECLAAELPGTLVVRMNGYRFEHLSNTGIPLPTDTVVRVVQVGEYWHERLKNDAVAEAILSGPITLPDPSIDASEADLALGRARLATLFGPTAIPTHFWFGCMGTTGDYYGDLKDWGTARWAEVLRFLVRDRGQSIVLVGGHAERQSLENVRAATGLPEQVVVTTGDLSEPEGLAELLGLGRLSQGYFGRDTGPMHIAAAVGKPVVAVFGAGMWPRFTPLATPSRVMAVDLPCAPCRWVCHLPESWCVKRVPVEAVKEALDAVISRNSRTREARLITASPELYEAARRP